METPILQAPESHRPLLPLGSARPVHHGLEVAALMGSWRAEENLYLPFCSESIKSWSVLDSSFQERIDLIVSLENKIAKREREGGSSLCALQLSWLRGSFALNVSAAFDFGIA